MCVCMCVCLCLSVSSQPASTWPSFRRLLLVKCIIVSISTSVSSSSEAHHPFGNCRDLVDFFWLLRICCWGGFLESVEPGEF